MRALLLKVRRKSKCFSYSVDERCVLYQKRVLL